MQRFKDSNPKSKGLVDYLSVIKFNFDLLQYKSTLKDLKTQMTSSTLQTEHIKLDASSDSDQVSQKTHKSRTTASSWKIEEKVQQNKKRMAKLNQALFVCNNVLMSHMCKRRTHFLVVKDSEVWTFYSSTKLLLPDHRWQRQQWDELLKASNGIEKINGSERELAASFEQKLTLV